MFKINKCAISGANCYNIRFNNLCYSLLCQFFWNEWIFWRPVINYITRPFKKLEKWLQRSHNCSRLTRREISWSILTLCPYVADGWGSLTTKRGLWAVIRKGDNEGNQETISFSTSLSTKRWTHKLRTVCHFCAGVTLRDWAELTWCPSYSSTGGNPVIWASLTLLKD